MDSVLAWLTAGGSLGAAGAAIWLAILNRQLVKDGQAARYDAQQPVLVPATGVSHLDGQNARYLDGYDIYINLLKAGLKNAGPGIAMNVRGVLFGPAALGMNDMRHVLHLNVPMEASAQLSQEGQQPLWQRESGLGQQHSLNVLGDDHIGNPPQPLHAGVGVIARMTLTATDIFRRKHLFMYDLTDGQEWREVLIQPIPHDLGDLSQTAR